MHPKDIVIAFLLMSVYFPSFGHKQSVSLLRTGRNDGTRTGFYSNCGFGYAFYIPKNFIGHGSPDGTPQHGLVIPLSTQPETYVWVDGSFNALDWRTLDDAATFYRKALNDRGDNVSIVQRRVTKLGHLHALWLTFSYNERLSSSTRIEEIILARRKSEREAEIIYTLGLKTPRKGYERNRRTFQRVLQTWWLKPLPCT